MPVSVLGWIMSNAFRISYLVDKLCHYLPRWFIRGSSFVFNFLSLLQLAQFGEIRHMRVILRLRDLVSCSNVVSVRRTSCRTSSSCRFETFESVNLNEFFVILILANLNLAHLSFSHRILFNKRPCFIISCHFSKKWWCTCFDAGEHDFFKQDLFIKIKLSNLNRKKNKIIFCFVYCIVLNKL